MKRPAFLLTIVSFCLSSSAIADTFGTGSNQFEIEFVMIGDPENRADTSGNPNPAGAVDYVYEIGKYEISREIIERASAEAELELTLHPMDFVTGGPRPEMPATGVSWNEAARFINWLNTSHGFPEAYKFTTQPGDADYDANANIELWEPIEPGYDPNNQFRNRLANYALPTVHERYKAAFYDPTVYGGFGSYWNFPNGSNEAPIPVVSGTDPNTAVYSKNLSLGPADVTQAGGLSPYGVMALGGNVWEWEETEFDLVNDTPSAVRGVRGGRWISLSHYLRVFDRDDDDLPTNELESTGFRVVSLSEVDSHLHFDITPGVGEFPASDDGDSTNFLRVEQISHGFRIAAFQDGTSDVELPEFSASWNTEEGQWYRFVAEVDSVSIANDERVARDAVGELESAERLRFGSHLLSPDPASGRYSFGWQFNPLGDDFGDASVTWEFTAVAIDPPIPGDANGDGSVTVADFLALAAQFGLDGLGWSGGDFNFDGTTDFDDFVILNNNFGSGTLATAAIPEPSTLALVTLGVLALLAVLRKA